MGEEIETLADLIPDSPRAICVGINPAPPSVAAGHYFEGRQGQRFYARLRQAGVLPPSTAGFEDDAALSVGIGFTDVVKRPTARSDEVPDRELRHGSELLRARLEAVGPPVTGPRDRSTRYESLGGLVRLHWSANSAGVSMPRAEWGR